MWHANDVGVGEWLGELGQGGVAKCLEDVLEAGIVTDLPQSAFPVSFREGHFMHLS